MLNGTFNFVTIMYKSQYNIMYRCIHNHSMHIESHDNEAKKSPTKDV